MYSQDLLLQHQQTLPTPILQQANSGTTRSGPPQPDQAYLGLKLVVAVLGQEGGGGKHGGHPPEPGIPPGLVGA